jgi:hypothetical protein
MPSKSPNYDSSGPDIRVRGNAYQVLEKYLQLARDAGTVGDRVAAENFLQHADHYYRVVASMNEGQRPRIGGREVSVAEVNVGNGSQGLSAAMSGHGHSGQGDENSAERPQDNHGNGQMHQDPSHQAHQSHQNHQSNQNHQSHQTHQSQGGAESENRQNAEAREAQSGNSADEDSSGNSSAGNSSDGNFSAPDEQPDYPEELLPADAAAAANAAPRDGQQQDGRNPGRVGRGRRRGPGRRVRNDGDEPAAPNPPSTPGETQ